jgi:hypothetical protein
VKALKVVPNYVCHIDQSSLEVFMRTFISFFKYLELKGEFVLTKQIGNLQNCWTNNKAINLSSFFEGSKIVKQKVLYLDYKTSFHRYMKKRIRKFMYLLSNKK